MECSIGKDKPSSSYGMQFTTNMSDEEFFGWLRIKGVADGDVARLKGMLNISTYHIAGKFGIKLGSLAVYICNCQIKIRLYFLLAYSIPYSQKYWRSGPKSLL